MYIVPSTVCTCTCMYCGWNIDVMVCEYLTTLIVKVYETLHAIETSFVTWYFETTHT